MKTTDRTAVIVGLEVHRRFSTVTGRNAEAKIAWRQRLEHDDRDGFRKRIEDWPRGIPVILESSFGWEWMCEELEQAGLEPCLASSRKVAAWRTAARGNPDTHSIRPCRGRMSATSRTPQRIDDPSMKPAPVKL